MDVDYGHQIRTARYARSWTRERLAAESGLTVDVIDAIENGETDPTRALSALRLVDLHLLLPELQASFMVTLQHIFAEIPQEKLPAVLGSILELAGNAVAGNFPTPRVSHITFVAGDMITPDGNKKVC